MSHRAVVGLDDGPAGVAFTTLICFIPIFACLLFGSVDSGAIALLSLPSLVIVLLWVWRSFRSDMVRLSTSKLQIPLAALALLGLVQLLPLRDAGVPAGLLSIPAVSSLTLDPYATRLFLLRLMLYLVFFAAALTYVSTLKRVRAVTVTMIVFGGLIAFYSILQRVEEPTAIYGVRAPEQAIPFGTYVNRHHFAALMEMTIGLTIGVIFGGALKRNRVPFLAVAAVVMGIALALTGSRGGMIALVVTVVVGVGLTAIFRSRSVHSVRSVRPGNLPLPLLIAGGFFFLAAVAAMSLFAGGGESLVRSIGLDPVAGDVSSGRLGFWQVALRIFADHPLIGAGLDAFGVAYTRYDPSSGMFRVEQAHNDYLQILADGGLVGFAIVAAFIFLLFRSGYRVAASAKDAFRRSTAVGALAGCSGILVHSFFDFPLRTPANTYFFLLLCALAVVVVRETEHGRRPRR